MSCPKPGYLGVASYNGSIIKCTGLSLDVAQEALFYNATLGLRDVVVGNKKGPASTGAHTPSSQKGLMRPGVKISNGSADFPLTEANGTYFLEEAKTGGGLNFKVQYDCEKGRQCPLCFVDSYSFSVSQGGYATIKVTLVGWATTDIAAFHNSNSTTVERIIDFSRVNIGLPVSDICIRDFNFTISNSFSPIYTAGANFVGSLLYPAAIRPQIQSVTGSITMYGKKVPLVEHSPSTTHSTITVSAPGYSVSMKVVFKPLTVSGAPGLYTSVWGFQGVDYPFG
jgi:hypothetical protein